MEAFLWRLRTKEHQDASMFPRSCMSTKVLVEDPQILSIDASLGDLDMQRLVNMIFVSVTSTSLMCSMFCFCRNTFRIFTYQIFNLD